MNTFAYAVIVLFGLIIAGFVAYDLYISFRSKKETKQTLESFLREQREIMDEVLRAPANPPPSFEVAHTQSITVPQVVGPTNEVRGLTEEESRDADMMAAEEEEEVAGARAMAEVESVNPRLPVPPRVSRRLNIGGQTYDVPDMAQGDDLRTFEQNTINDLMLRRGRQLMAQEGMTAEQAARAVQEMVAHAGVGEVARHAVDPLNLFNAMQDGALTPDQRLRLGEDMMIRHAENLIRGGMSVEEAATRAADWGMQFAQFGPASPAERRPSVQEVWRD